jgi:16S rRNA (cytidine1402-2'-O)-methyltransferase
MGDLYIVSTPIGNLEDITLRALRILKEVDRIACEDTRRTRNLLARYGIRTGMLSYHDHNKITAAKRILRILEKDNDVALVSDAGTPTIADPGFYLVRAAIEKGVRVIPLPGASIVLTALVVSGLPTIPFTFLGYLPRSISGVKQVCEEVKGRKETLIFLDSPKRLRRDLALMAEVLGDRESVVGREVTKIHEDFMRGCLSFLAGHCGSGSSSGLKGEVVILVDGAGDVVDEDEIVRFIRRQLREGGVTARDLCREVIDTFEIGRNQAYKMVISLMGDNKEAGV